MFNNTQEQWDNLIINCRQDSDFNEGYTTRFFPYLHAIYLYDATADHNKNDISEPFDILDVNNYQALDNNAICYKHIDYTLNNDALNFGDIFTFAEANKNIASNIKANSCYFNLIISTYKDSMESVMMKGKRVYRELTPEYLCQIMEIENKDQDLGLSIRASVKFFEKFHLGLIVVNVYDDVIFKYIPEIRHKNINPQTLYVLVYNSHCYRLNSNENSFVHKLNLKDVIDEEKETYENLKMKLSTNFYFRNFDKESKKVFIDNLDDCVQIIKDNEEGENINFITNTDLTKILFQMVDNKYIPYTSFESGILSRLSFKLKHQIDDEKATVYSIQQGDSSMIENEIMTVEQDEIKPYDKADRLAARSRLG